MRRTGNRPVSKAVSQAFSDAYAKRQSKAAEVIIDPAAIKEAVRLGVSDAMSKRSIYDPCRTLDRYPTNMAVRQVSTYFGCSIQHVHNLVDCGALTAVNIAMAGTKQRALRITRDSVAAYEKANRL